MQMTAVLFYLTKNNQSWYCKVLISVQIDLVRNILEKSVAVQLSERKVNYWNHYCELSSYSFEQISNCDLHETKHYVLADYQFCFVSL